MPERPENIYPNIDDNIPAQQHVAGTPVSGSVSVDMSRATIIYDIPPESLEMFCAFQIGFCQKGASTKIARTLPKRHPIFSYMWAARVSGIEGIGPTGKTDAQYGTTAAFKRYRVTVEYETPRYIIKEDGATTKEWERFTITAMDPNGEFIQRKVGSFQWPAATPNVGGQPIADTNGTSQLLVKNRMTYSWIQVPDDGFFTSGGAQYGGVPTKVLDGLGKVNNATFMGYEKGTLLLEGFKPTTVILPVDGFMVGALAGFPGRAWNVDFHITYFNPPPADPAIRGHNLLPHPTNGLWYRAFQTGGADTETFWRYREYDFEKLFEMNV